jgi:hypothetical protein
MSCMWKENISKICEVKYLIWTKSSFHYNVRQTSKHIADTHLYFAFHFFPQQGMDIVLYIVKSIKKFPLQRAGHSSSIYYIGHIIVKYWTLIPT